MSPTELVLVVVLVVVVVRDIVVERSHAAERRRLVHAVIARSAPEYAAIERKVTTQAPRPDVDERPVKPVPVGLD